MANNAERIQFLVSRDDGFTRSRLPALYSDFRGLRSTNPEGYAANIAAWRRGLASLVRTGMLPAASSTSTSAVSNAGRTSSVAPVATAARNFLVLTAGQPLLDALQSDRYGRPLALDAVIREATQDHDMIPLQAFLQATESIYNSRSWVSWAALPWHALSWGLHRLGVGGGASLQTASSPPFEGKRATASYQLVVVANVEAAAAAFAAKTADLRSPFERTWSIAHFKRVFSGPGAVLDNPPSTTTVAVQQPRLSETDLHVLITFLARDKHLVVCDGRVVKLRTPGDNSSSGNGNDTTITEADRAVAQLRELLDSLSHQTAVLSKRIDDLTAAAKDAVLRKNRVAALAALKSKKQTEAALSTRFATLAQVEATAARIEEAADHVQVVQAMATSADALKALNAQVGGAGGVEAVVDRLRDQMDAADEIGRILTEAGPTSTTAGGTGLVVDEGEIDDELAALEREEQQAVEAKKEKERESAKKHDEAARKQAEAGEKAAEETRQRLALAGTVPGHPVGNEADAQAESEVALEAETTASLRNLSLNREEPQAEAHG
ncbi:snf7 family protein [Niveomyces insectorum RCEF 264]|uniref:Snf7 family protein n=1 Tax=Niveomyces insectorum RCEF 264 TaxID=1081102 RepID=A0A168A717_9HYPO|nr:snf7 family protein [Niveomyces insectorum RCEF 264]